MQRFVCLLLFALVWVWAGEGFAQQPTVEERLIRVEEGQKALIQRFDDLRADLNQRFSVVDQRFGELRADMNQRFADLTFWLQTIVGILVLVVGGLIALCFVIWCRLVRLDARFNHFRATEKDRMLAFHRDEIEPLEARLERLEAAGRS